MLKVMTALQITDFKSLVVPKLDSMSSNLKSNEFKPWMVAKW